ncbi:MAG: TIGR00725 family protein [Acidimicrobiia bacterium]
MIHVAVVGPGHATPAEESAAEVVGAELARAGALVVCGGLGGVMAAACRGAASAGGTTLGLLPGVDRSDANEWVTVAVPTGLGEGRNALVVRTADAVVAVGGAYGTLSEIALALRAGTPVVGWRTWDLTSPGGQAAPIVHVDDPADAARTALRLAGAGGYE